MNSNTANTKLEEIFKQYENTVLNKGAAGSIVGKEVLEVALLPEYYDDDGEKKIKCTITLESKNFKRKIMTT